MEPTVAQSHEQDLAPPEPDPRPDDLYPDIVGIAAKGPIFAIASDLPQVARPVYHAPRYSEAGDPFDDETKLTTLIRQPLLRVERRRLPPQLHHGSSSPPKPPTLGTSHSEPLLARSAPLDKQADWWHDIPNKQVHSPTLRETASDQRLRLTEELSQDSLVQCHQYHDGSRPLSSLSNDSKTGPSGSPGEDTVLLSTDQSAILTSPSRLNQQRSFGGHPLQSIPEDEITQSSRSPSQNPLVTTNPREEISAPRSDATQTEIIPAGSPPEQVCKIHDAQIAPEDWQGPGVSDTGINSSGCSGNVADQHLDLSLPVNPNELAVSRLQRWRYTSMTQMPQDPGKQRSWDWRCPHGQPLCRRCWVKSIALIQPPVSNQQCHSQYSSNLASTLGGIHPANSILELLTHPGPSNDPSSSNGMESSQVIMFGCATSTENRDSNGVHLDILSEAAKRYNQQTWCDASSELLRHSWSKPVMTDPAKVEFIDNGAPNLDKSINSVTHPVAVPSSFGSHRLRGVGGNPNSDGHKTVPRQHSSVSSSDDIKVPTNSLDVQPASTGTAGGKAAVWEERYDPRSIRARLGRGERINPWHPRGLALLAGLNPDYFSLPLGSHVLAVKARDVACVWRSLESGVWDSGPTGNLKIQDSYGSRVTEAPILFLVSLPCSQSYCGLAEIAGPLVRSRPDSAGDMTETQGSFPVRWIYCKNVSFDVFAQMRPGGRQATDLDNCVSFPNVLGRKMVKKYVQEPHMSNIILADPSSPGLGLAPRTPSTAQTARPISILDQLAVQHRPGRIPGATNGHASAFRCHSEPDVGDTDTQCRRASINLGTWNQSLPTNRTWRDDTVEREYVGLRQQSRGHAGMSFRERMASMQQTQQEQREETREAPVTHLVQSYLTKKPNLHPRTKRRSKKQPKN